LLSQQIVELAEAQVADLFPARESPLLLLLYGDLLPPCVLLKKQNERLSRVNALTPKNYFTEMCSGSEAGSYSRRINFVNHSSLGLRVKNKKEQDALTPAPPQYCITYLLERETEFVRSPRRRRLGRMATSLHPSFCERQLR